MSEGNEIIVLLSTFNGCEYLKEQIDSILSQEDVELTILARDDGSSDSTKSLLKQYDAEYDNFVYVNPNDSENLGFNGSFIDLIKRGLSYGPDCQLFAFADQDDVWKPKKLLKAVETIRNGINEDLESFDQSVYYYANKCWCDKSLNPIHYDDMSSIRNDYFDMFMLPPVYGCTTVFNRNLAELLLMHPYPDGLLYDVYMYRIACLTGGTLVSDSEPCIFYRRHGSNASGDAMKLSPLKNLLNLLSGKRDYHGMQKYVSVVYANYYSLMSDKMQNLSVLIKEYDHSLSAKARLLTWKDAYRRGPKTAVIWASRVLLNAI